MDAYPYIETLKVGAAYIALLYAWPNAVFRRTLRGKGLTFRFLFCAMVQPLLISTAVLSLGLLHVLTAWVVRVLFWGALAVSLLAPLRNRRGGPAFRIEAVPAALSARRDEVLQRYRKHLTEYLVLAGVLLFAAAFFLNGAFHDYSFGFNDLYLHYEWTDALTEGKIFADGIYPEGMHCFIYAVHVLFGAKLHSCIVFLGGVHNASTFLLAAYCLFKELFRSRHAALFVVAAWSFFDGIGQPALVSMTRMTWTLPEEFGLYLVFLCPLVLLRHIREREGCTGWYRDWNLLFLAAGVASAVSTHFYVLGMAFFPCCAVLLAHCTEFRRVRRLFPPVCAALCGLAFGAFPMLTAYATGTRLQGSLGWGMNVINGADGADAGLTGSAGRTLLGMARALYEKGWLTLFGTAASVLLILVSLLAFVLVIADARHRRKLGKTADADLPKQPHKAARHRQKSRKGGKPRKAANAQARGGPGEAAMPAGVAKGYLVLALSLAASVFLYAMPEMGLPELVRNIRTLCVTQMFAFGVGGILVDLLVLLAELLWGKELPRVLMALECLLLYLFAYGTDFHQTTYWWLGRYNAAVAVTDRIMGSYPEGAYRIVSMRDEAYQAGKENQEELFAFLEGTGKEGYSIPAEYVFLYVEKHPIRWGQVHFTTAPRWLALDNWKAHWEDWDPSRCPDIWYGEIFMELAREELDYDSMTEETACYDMAVRVALCSKAYAWYAEFSAEHPNETEAYYEDDDFVCYMIHQDPSAPLDLSAGAGGPG